MKLRHWCSAAVLAALVFQGGQTLVGSEQDRKGKGIASFGTLEALSLEAAQTSSQGVRRKPYSSGICPAGLA